ncbi:flagellar biosynthetic protein FliO [Caenimonas sp. SL110]|uniref:flagellar biosynthetic protein FliO n=1 Tax=Caenimonas sp. SL110 TaxID=1450524 RepID=UPI0006532216|nr:flagellar biosynthetic protein FliO [Caenimonas sp. SL110]
MTTFRCKTRNRVAALALFISSAACLAQPATPAVAASVPVSASAPASAPASASASASSFPGIPLQRDETSASNAQSALFAVLFLLAIASAGFFLVKHRGRVAAQSPGSMPRIVSRTSLTNQASLHTVEWDGKELLLGVTANGVSLLAQRALQRDNAASEVSR